MKLALRFIILLIAAGLCACVGAAGVREDLKAWEGRHYDDLVAALGVPQQVQDNGKSGKIIVYAKGETVVVPGMAFSSYSPSVPQAALTPSYGTPGRIDTRSTQKIFWVDSAGKIYRTAYHAR